ncbi:MAG: glutamate 5-kinase [Lachnospiraceae bacterium]|nr:glutamate 5-kinase [Lachnospiraceae bacterium]
MNNRERLKDKKRIVIKIGSSSLTHPETGKLNLMKLEKLVRIIADIHNSGKDVILVSSGAIAVGRNKVGLSGTLELPQKQACAAIGQAQLMMIYQKLFSEYNQIAAQVLMTKDTMTNDMSRKNAENTFSEILKLRAIPIVNENDTVSTYEIQRLLQFGDNDRLSAMVAALANADLLILLSDIDGLFTDDPNKNPDAKFIECVSEITDDLYDMGKSSSSSNVGTGGMNAKLHAANIATKSGADMVIANGDDVEVLCKIIAGENAGTLFLANKDEGFNIQNYLSE